MRLVHGSLRFLYHPSQILLKLIKVLNVLHLVRNVAYELFGPMQSKNQPH
jgi:hypothetical protein